MARRPRHNPRLQDRDYDILQHVDRYRLTTPEILHRLFFFQKDENGNETDELLARNAVTKVTSRLCTDEFLAGHMLYGSNVYFTLGWRGAKLFRLAAGRVGAIGPQALYRDFGVLYFCCQGQTAREKLRFSDVQQKYPLAIAKGLDSSHYYIDHHDGISRLAYIWVEAAGTVAHIAHKIRYDIIEHRRQVPVLRQLIDEGRFAVAVVTYSDDKRAAIIDALRQIPTTVAFRVEVVSELRHLLP